jgi:hypothetical protein
MRIFIRSFKWLISTMLLVVVGASVASAGPVLSLASGDTTSFDAGTYRTFGWSFTTNQAITVYTLDAVNPAGDGYVDLYDAAGDVLASATVSYSDLVESGNAFSFYAHELSTPVSLAANTVYYIAEDVPVNSVFYSNATGIVTDTAISYGAGVSAIGAKQTTTTDDPNHLGWGYFGPNFDIVSPAPEPSTLLMGLTASVFGAVAAWRRRRAGRSV